MFTFTKTFTVKMAGCFLKRWYWWDIDGVNDIDFSDGIDDTDCLSAIERVITLMTL